MHKNYLGFGLILLIGLLGACNKQGTDSIISAPPKVWGKMSAVLQHRKIISGSDTLNFYDEIAQGQFLANPDLPGVYMDAGVVKINDNELTRDGSNLYLKMAQNLDIQNNLKWHVAGQGQIPNIVYYDTVAYPIYTGPVPFSVNKATGITLVLDATTVSGADSVRILIDDGGSNMVQKTFSATAGNVLITPGDMTALNVVTDQTAIIGIYPYKGVIKAINSKGFFYVRERRLRQSININ